MAQKDWDPEEFLTFNYKKNVPERDGKAHSVSDNANETHKPQAVNKVLNQPAPQADQSSHKVPADLSKDILPPMSGDHHQSRSVSGSTEGRATSEELRRYAELRHSSVSGPGAQNSASVSDARKASASASQKPSALFGGKGKKAGKSGSAGKSARDRLARAAKAAKSAAKEEEPVPIPAGQDYHRTQADEAALRKAQKEAYERYHSTYSKNYLKNKKNLQPHMSHKLLSIVYLIAAIAFAVSLTIMDVLPFRILALIYGILILLSLIIVMHLRRKNIRRWIRVFASLAAILLIGCYGVGTAYALGTLSFLDFTSVKNENRVASITGDPFNVVITGIDAWGKIDEEEGRSDVNMVVTVNPKTETILMTSIPRDYQIYMPDKDNAMDKLTHTGFYSVETTIGAEEELLDTKMNYYVKVNFTTVEKFIDAIGGVDVYSEYEFVPIKLDTWTCKEGMNHMNGEQALAFARERKAFLTGDNQRVKNQQAVFEAMIKKATSSKTMLLSYNKVISSLKDYFRMSFSSSEFRSLIKYQIAKDPDWKIYKNALVGDNGSMGTYTTGYAQAYIMLQDEYSITNARTLIAAVKEGKELAEDDDGLVYVKDAEGEEGEGGEEAEQ